MQNKEKRARAIIKLTDEFKDNYLAYLRDMYAEGIIDQDAFTQNNDQATLKSKSGDVTGMFFRAASNGQVTEEYAMDYVTLTPFVEENFPLTHGISKGDMSITDKCEHPEVLIAWVDYLYSEEGGRLAYLGIEGTIFEIADMKEKERKWRGSGYRVVGKC